MFPSGLGIFFRIRDLKDITKTAKLSFSLLGLQLILANKLFMNIKISQYTDSVWHLCKCSPAIHKNTLIRHTTIFIYG